MRIWDFVWLQFGTRSWSQHQSQTFVTYLLVNLRVFKPGLGRTLPDGFQPDNPPECSCITAASQQGERRA